MAVDERRRVELFERLSAALGQEAATTLSELLPPRGGDVATTDDVTYVVTEMRSESAQIRSEMEAMEHRLVTVFERRISQAVTAQTRTLVVSQLAALVAIAALAFGLR